MSTTALNLDLMAPPIVKVWGRRMLIVGVVASVIALALAFKNPGDFFHAYLVSFMDWLGVALGSMAILMLRHLTKGGWGMVIRRMLGAAMRTIPLLTLLFAPIVIFGMKDLYVWARPEEVAKSEHLQHITHSYLSINGFVVRAAFYFVIWNLISFFLTKWSKEQDRPDSPDHTARFKALSGPGILLYGFTISFAAIDWVMSLDPTWISTIYGLLILIGQLINALCFAIIVERILYNYKPMSQLLQKEHVHDHGKFLLAFIMVWAYFSFSQWLIIWAGNLPEEITWYLRRLNGGWGGVGLFLVIFHFAIPFFILLSRSFKRDITKLVWLAAWMLIARYVDLYWLIEPNFSLTFRVTLADIVLPFAIGGLWLSYFCRNLASMALVPAYDPFAQEVLVPEHHHG
jgi:hypothetical protein